MITDVNAIYEILHSQQCFLSATCRATTVDSPVDVYPMSEPTLTESLDHL